MNETGNAFDALKNKQAGKNENLNAGEDDLITDEEQEYEDEFDETGNADLEDEPPPLDEQDLEDNDLTDEEADEVEWD